MTISPEWRSRRRCQAFTLVEVMVVTVVFLLVITGVISSQLYGLKMATKMSIKLTASTDARETLGQLIQDVRAANSLRIGTGTATTFTDTPDFTNQTGTALQIYATTDTNTWVRFYYEGTSNRLMRTDNTGAFKIVSANSITNDHIIFAEEDYLGQVITNRTTLAVIDVDLSFIKLNNPLVPIGPGNDIDFYFFNTRITPRIRP